MREDCAEVLSGEAGSEHGDQELWDLLSRADCLKAKDNKATLTRWFEFLTRWRQYDKEYGFHQFSVNLACLQTGVFRKVCEMPVWQLPAKRIALAKAAAKKAGKKQNMAQQSAADKLNRQRDQAKNALHLTALVMGQPMQQRKGKLILEITKPCYTAFAKELRGMASKDGVLSYYTIYALHAYGFVLSATFATLQSPAALARMRFVTEGAKAGHYQTQMRAGASSSSSSSALPPFFRPLVLLPQDEEEGEMANLAWALAMGVVRHRGMSMHGYAMALAGTFVLLIARSATDREEGLRMHKEMWESIEEAERQQFSHSSVRKLLMGIFFLHNPVIREVLLGFAQHNFWVIPPGIASVARCVFEGWGSSAIVERGFQRCRDHARSSTNREMNRQTRFFVPYERELTKEHGRGEVHVAQADLHSGAKPTPKGVFEAMAAHRASRTSTSKPSWNQRRATTARTRRACSSSWRRGRCCASRQRMACGTRSTWLGTRSSRRRDPSSSRGVRGLPTLCSALPHLLRLCGRPRSIVRCSFASGGRRWDQAFEHRGSRS